MAESTVSLAVWRFVVGLGVGTILPSLNTLVAEFSSHKRRELAVTVMQAGFPTGAVVGGVVAVLVIAQFGWRGIFWVGAGLSLLAWIAAWWRLPESVDYLLTRQPSAALTRVNLICRRLSLPVLQELPAPVSPTGSPLGFKALVQPQHLANTLYLAAAFFFVMASYYFVASWTPKLLVDAGLSLTAGISGGVVLSAGGIIGGLLLGWVSGRFSARLLTMSFMLLTIPMMVLFSLTTSLPAMLPAAFVMGFFLLGSMMGLYAVTPGVFEASTRATATGIVVGVGRFGAILGPLLTGLLLDQGWQAMELYRWVGLPLLLSAGAVLFLHRKVLHRKVLHRKELHRK